MALEAQIAADRPAVMRGVPFERPAERGAALTALLLENCAAVEDAQAVHAAGAEVEQADCATVCVEVKPKVGWKPGLLKHV